MGRPGPDAVPTGPMPWSVSRIHPRPARPGEERPRARRPRVATLLTSPAGNTYPMDPLHARYPFLEVSREAAREADADLSDLVAGGDPVLDRARERVERALLEGTAAPAEAWPPRVELLSYPVARVLVSLLDVPGANEKYARAEADLAHERFVADFEEDLRTDRGNRLALADLLADFDLESAVAAAPVVPDGTTGAAANVDGRESVRVERTGGGGGVGVGARETEADGEQFFVDVTAYLRLAAGLEGEQWRLTGRALSGGRVPVDRRELYTLVGEAVRRRVEDGLAGLAESVPDEVESALADEISALREELAEVTLSGEIDTVVPGLFPPCMRRLLARAGEEGLLSLPEHSRFSLVAFLASCGLDAEGVTGLCAVNGPAAGEAVAQQVARLRDDRDSQFAPPSCETMVAYGDCVNKDDLCETISHPLEYYEQRLAGAPGEKVVDWRER